MKENNKEIFYIKLLNVQAAKNIKYDKIQNCKKKKKGLAIYMTDEMLCL